MIAKVAGVLVVHVAVLCGRVVRASVVGATAWLMVGGVGPDVAVWAQADAVSTPIARRSETTQAGGRFFIIRPSSVQCPEKRECLRPGCADGSGAELDYRGRSCSAADERPVERVPDGSSRIDSASPAGDVQDRANVPVTRWSTHSVKASGG